MLGERFEMVTECAVVKTELSVVTEPNKELSPYSICESEGTSVCQVIVADEVLIAAVSIEEITTPDMCTVLLVLPAVVEAVVVSGTVTVTDPLAGNTAVVKVLSGVTAKLPIASLDFIR